MSVLCGNVRYIPGERVASEGAGLRSTRHLPYTVENLPLPCARAHRAAGLELRGVDRTDGMGVYERCFYMLMMAQEIRILFPHLIPVTIDLHFNIAGVISVITHKVSYFFPLKFTFFLQKP